MHRKHSNVSSSLKCVVELYRPYPSKLPNVNAVTVRLTLWQAFSSDADDNQGIVFFTLASIPRAFVISVSRLGFPLLPSHFFPCAWKPSEAHTAAHSPLWARRWRANNSSYRSAPDSCYCKFDNMKRHGQKDTEYRSHTRLHKCPLRLRWW